MSFELNDSEKSCTDTITVVGIDFDASADSMKIRLPQEALEQLNGEWPWEVYLDEIPVDQLDENCLIKRKDSEFILEITRAVLDKLDLSIGDSFVWKVEDSDDGKEIFVSSIIKEDKVEI